jgi:hypothetical protein
MPPLQTSVRMGWLNLSDEEQRRARACLRQFQTEGTLDELGFGIIRDAFADVFFPATSTIMTRTRYLIFVAATFMCIERERLSGVKAARRLKILEDGLRSLLTRENAGSESEKKERGVIGASAKGDLQRYPSSIYWNALKRLGLFQRPRWGLTYYLDHLVDYYSATTPRKDDDGLAHLAATVEPTWDPQLGRLLPGSAGISKELEFQSGVDFDLTRAEATYLKDGFVAMASEGGSSLIAHLLTQAKPVEFNFPWETKCSDLEVAIDHARAFSMFTKGATLQYYELLVEAQRTKGLLTSDLTFEKPFEQWWDLTKERLGNWDLDAFLALVRGMCRLRPNDSVFLAAWLRLCRDAKSGKEFLADPQARELIRRREWTVRHVKYRLGQDKYLRQWEAPESLDGREFTDPEFIPYLLDYRSGIGGRFVSEIVTALRR